MTISLDLLQRLTKVLSPTYLIELVLRKINARKAIAQWLALSKRSTCVSCYADLSEKINHNLNFLGNRRQRPAIQPLAGVEWYLLHQGLEKNAPSGQTLSSNTQFPSPSVCGCRTDPTAQTGLHAPKNPVHQELAGPAPHPRHDQAGDTRARPLPAPSSHAHVPPQAP